MTMAWQQHLAKGLERGKAQSDRGAAKSEPGRVRILDWVESQTCVTRIWLDELIAKGDPDDLVSELHKQAAWLELMRDRLRQAS